jgi:hypothetical protein
MIYPALLFVYISGLSHISKTHKPRNHQSISQLNPNFQNIRHIPMAPPHPPPTSIVPPPPLQKRSECDSYYPTSECATHRTIILIIIIIVGLLVCIIFSLVYARSRRRRNASHGRRDAYKRAIRARQEALHTTEEVRMRTRWGGGATVVLPSGQRKDSWDEGRSRRYEAPPPYMPRAPEPVRSR